MENNLSKLWLRADLLQICTFTQMLRETQGEKAKILINDYTSRKKIAPEDVVMYVVLLGILGCQNKCLHEASHGLPIVRELARHLHYHTIGQGLVGIHLRNTIKTFSMKT